MLRIDIYNITDNPTSEFADYRYEVRAEGLIENGLIDGHRRSDGWRALVRRIVDRDLKASFEGHMSKDVPKERLLAVIKTPMPIKEAVKTWPAARRPKKLTRRQREIEARKAADPLAQAVGRDDIDYSSDDLPTAPR